MICYIKVLQSVPTDQCQNKLPIFKGEAILFHSVSRCHPFFSPTIGKREFIKSLQTTDKSIAVPLALRLAATAKQLFHGLKQNMSEADKNKLMGLLREKKHRCGLMNKPNNMLTN